MSNSTPGATRRLRDLPLWEPKFSPAVLAEKAKSEDMFAQGFLMRVLKPGELMFPSFSKCWQDAVPAAQLAQRRMPVALGVDLSGKKRKGTAIAAVGLDPPTKKRNLVEVRHGAWSSPDTVKYVDEMVRAHDVSFIMVEDNGYQAALIEWVQDQPERYPWWMKVEAHTTTGQNKHSPEIGLQSFAVEFDNAGWVFPSREWAGHPNACACSWCEMKRQIGQYPKAAYTDILMAIWFAKSAIDRWMVWALGASAAKGLGRIGMR